jgi:hypothetical protein
MHRQGRKTTAGTGPIEGMGVGTTTFWSAVRGGQHLYQRIASDQRHTSLNRVGLNSV